VSRESIRTWSEVEAEFVAAMYDFDTARSAERMSDGEYRKKAGVFNQLVIDILGNFSGRELGMTQKRNSLAFDKIDIDICYPKDGALTPIAGAEVKILGAPPHSGNKHKARSASIDLHKRLREVAFTCIDFKAAYAPPMPISTLSAWCGGTHPRYYSFWALRMADEGDFVRTRSMLNGLSHYCNRVGAIFYGPKPSGAYVRWPASELSLDSAMREMAQEIVS